MGGGNIEYMVKLVTREKSMFKNSDMGYSMKCSSCLLKGTAMTLVMQILD